MKKKTLPLKGCRGQTWWGTDTKVSVGPSLALLSWSVSSLSLCLLALPTHHYICGCEITEATRSLKGTISTDTSRGTHLKFSCKLSLVLLGQCFIWTWLLTVPLNSTLLPPLQTCAQRLPLHLEKIWFLYSISDSPSIFSGSVFFTISNRASYSFKP